jgi:hypothetical protein
MRAVLLVSDGLLLPNPIMEGLPTIRQLIVEGLHLYCRNQVRFCVITWRT